MRLLDSFYQFDALRQQLRKEAFNLLNKTNFRPPDANFTSGGFGTVTSANDARQLQVALKLSF